MDKLFIIKNAQSYRLGILCFLLFLLTSCVESPLYEQNIAIPNHYWSAENIPEFKFNIPDNKQAYDIFLNLRHTSKYGLSNVSFIIHEIGSKGQDKSYRIKLLLATPDGRWKGVGTGNTFSRQVRILKNHHFPDTGTYTIKVQQNMQINPLLEIMNIGIRVSKSRNN